MSSWLTSLPHQIPFRAASAIRVHDESRATGLFLCPGADPPAGASPQLALLEAMAQVGGALVFAASAEPGLLTALDGVTFDGVPVPGDSIEIEVVRDTSLGGLHRLRATAVLGGKVIARARIVLGTAARRE